VQTNHRVPDVLLDVGPVDKGVVDRVGEIARTEDQDVAERLDLVDLSQKCVDHPQCIRRLVSLHEKEGKDVEEEEEEAEEAEEEGKDRQVN